MEDYFSDAYELVYGEAVRALERQRDAFESLRTRAGVLLSGAAIASSLFGGQAVALEMLGLFGWLAVTSFACLGLALLVVLWPRAEWEDSPLPSRLLEEYIEIGDPLQVGVIRRELALVMERTYNENDQAYERLARSFRLAAILLNVEVVCWTIDLAVHS